MSEQAPQVNARVAMSEAVDAARVATQHLDTVNQDGRTGHGYSDFGQQGEIMKVGASPYGPSVETSPSGRTSARLDSRATGVEYHAYDNPDGSTGATVRYPDGHERAIQKPETVQKIIGKIATQVERRAEAATDAASERRAA